MEAGQAEEQARHMQRPKHQGGALCVGGTRAKDGGRDAVER